jgi:UDP-glucose 4-epimerase
VIAPLHAERLRGAQALVLGATGFLGSSLVIALDALGARVRAAVRRELPRNLDAVLAAALSRSELVRADLRDQESLARVTPDEGFVFVTAGLSGACSSLERASLDLEVNGGGVLALLEAIRTKRSRVRVVFPSSQLVYGSSPSGAALAEDALPRPRSIYAVHKLLGEHYGELYGRLYGVEWITLRVANPFGPRQRPSSGAYGLVRHFLDCALRGESVPVFGEGAQRRGYVYVDDLVRALLAGASVGQAGHAYNISHPTAHSVRGMAEAVIRACGRGRIATVPWPMGAQQVEPGDSILDVSRARTELGWEPEVSLEEGLARTVTFLREQVS